MDSLLDAYRRLEHRLFDQVDKKIYAKTGTGAGFELARYSAGSAADPSRRNPNWNRSYELKSDAPAGGVLLLHDMSDSPYGGLGCAKGWVIHCPRPGAYGLGIHRVRI